MELNFAETSNLINFNDPFQNSSFFELSNNPLNTNTTYEYPVTNYTFTEEEIIFEFKLMLRQYFFELYKKRQKEQLYAVPWTLVIILSILYGSISFTSLLGNGLVIWVVSVSRKMRTVTNLYIVNLALADIIIGIFSIPFQFQAALLQRWHLPKFMCAFCPFFQVLSVNLSVFTLSAIALDRHRAVLHPLRSRPSRKMAGLITAFVWITALGLAAPTFLDYKVVTSRQLFVQPYSHCRNVGLSSGLRFYYNLSLVATQYFVPLLIISVAYIRMAVRLWGRIMPGNREEGRDAIMFRNKKRAIKMLILVVLMFGVCWLPLQTYNLVQHIYPRINNYQYINVIWFCIHWLAMSNSCVNPFIYAIYNEKFQDEFSSRLGCLKSCSGLCGKKDKITNSVLLVLTDRRLGESVSVATTNTTNNKTDLLQNSTRQSKSALIFSYKNSKSESSSVYLTKFSRHQKEEKTSQTMLEVEANAGCGKDTRGKSIENEVQDEKMGRTEQKSKVVAKQKNGNVLAKTKTVLVENDDIMI